MRATVEYQEKKPSLDPLEVTIVLGNEDLSIKVTCIAFPIPHYSRHDGWSL